MLGHACQLNEVVVALDVEVVEGVKKGIMSVVAKLSLFSPQVVKDEETNCIPAVFQLALGLFAQVKLLIHGFEKEKISVPKLINCSLKSKQLFISSK